MTALLITKTSRNNHTLYTKMYHNGGSLTNTITNKTELYALRDGSLIGTHTCKINIVMGSLPLPTGGAPPPACMYSTQKHFLVKMLDTVDSIQGPVGSDQVSSGRVT